VMMLEVFGSRVHIITARVGASITIVSEVEHAFTCPYCGEEISMVLDLSVRRQTYVEDCEVCCNPIEISYTVEDDTLADFSAKTLE
jgi:transcription elongation factor Elf1